MAAMLAAVKTMPAEPPFLLHRRVYRATIDRAGLSLALGTAMGGVGAAVLAVLGMGAAPGAIVASMAAGMLVSATMIVLLAAPLWLWLHRRGWRGAGHAALLGWTIGFGLLLVGQTHGLGLFAAAPSDWRTQQMRWISAAAVAALGALYPAAIALAMWRTAYRRAR